MQLDTVIFKGTRATFEKLMWEKYLTPWKDVSVYEYRGVRTVGGPAGGNYEHNQQQPEQQAREVIVLENGLHDSIRIGFYLYTVDSDFSRIKHGWIDPELAPDDKTCLVVMAEDDYRERMLERWGNWKDRLIDEGWIDSQEINAGNGQRIKPPDPDQVGWAVCFEWYFSVGKPQQHMTLKELAVKIHKAYGYVRQQAILHKPA